MKKFLSIMILLGLLGLTYLYQNQIIEFVVLNFVYKNEFNYINVSEYQKPEFAYFKQTNNYKPLSKNDMANIIYSNLNNGTNEFNFYCMNEYENCQKDVESITNDMNYLSNINNFLSPYNTYNSLGISVSNLGIVNIRIDRYYDKTMINQINQRVDEIMSQIITNEMSDRDKIKAIHDYIIDNTIYDKEKEMFINTNYSTTYESHLAYGPLFQGHGICSGYSDLMSIFLDKLNIPNYRISNDDHVWNLVFVDNQWLHIDVTWDDPVLSTGEQIISYDYFLITTNELHTKDQTKHEFNEELYSEAKNI